MGTRLQTARVKGQEGYTTFTRTTDNLGNVQIGDSNVLIIRADNADQDAIAFFNPLGWQSVELEWEESDANS